MDRIKEGMKQASENSKRASESAKGLKDVKIPDDVKGIHERFETSNGFRKR
jgi:hypothetical protein